MSPSSVSTRSVRGAEATCTITENPNARIANPDPYSSSIPLTFVSGYEWDANCTLKDTARDSRGVFIRHITGSGSPKRTLSHLGGDGTQANRKINIGSLKRGPSNDFLTWKFEVCLDRGDCSGYSAGFRMNPK